MKSEKRDTKRIDYIETNKSVPYYDYSAGGWIWSPLSGSKVYKTFRQAINEFLSLS